MKTIWRKIQLIKHSYLAKRKYKKYQPIVVIGDSHVNFFSGNENISFSPLCFSINHCKDRTDSFATYHLGPALAYTLNKFGSTTNTREKVDFLIENNYLYYGATVLCCFGEIDIRVHVLKQSVVQNKPVCEIIDEILDNYINFCQYLTSKNYSVFCWGVIPSQSDTSLSLNPDFPIYGSEAERNHATQQFNEKIKKRCADNGIGFISISDCLIDANSKTKTEFIADDGCHLSQSARPLMISKFKEINMDVQ